jgi:hypothetical protein
VGRCLDPKIRITPFFLENSRVSASVCGILRIGILAVLTQVLLSGVNAQSALPESTPSGPAAAASLDQPAIINGRPYVRPSAKAQFKDYLRDSYGLPALARTVASAAYWQAVGEPDGWDQDWPGFGQRLGSSAASTAIGGNVRYGMELAFHEDMRYIPCHGCSVKRKIANALLAEVTARHDRDGRRFFTLTPVIADMSGRVIANTFWIPNRDPIDGVIRSRFTFATRIGGHLFSEFVLERRHRDPKFQD